jgi:hypothetical protein
VRPPLRSEAANTAAFTEFDGWIVRYLSTVPTEREALIPEGLQLAEVRRTVLAALIPTDPKQALDRAVPMAVRQALPPMIVARLEERVNAKGFYGVLGVLPDPTKPAPSEPPIRREVRLGEARALHGLHLRREAPAANDGERTPQWHRDRPVARARRAAPPRA